MHGNIVQVYIVPEFIQSQFIWDFTKNIHSHIQHEYRQARPEDTRPLFSKQVFIFVSVDVKLQLNLTV